MMTRPRAFRSLVLWGLVSVAAPAAAQGPPIPTPFAGLFGGQVRQRSESLTLGGSLFGVYQDVLLPSDQEAAVRETDPRFQKNGGYAGASGSLDYSYNRRSENATLSFGGRGSIATFSSSPETALYTLGTSAGLSTKLTRRIDFSSSASAAYSPLYDFAPFTVASGSLATVSGTSVLDRPEFGFAAAASSNINTIASVGVTGALTKRTSVYSTLMWRRTFFVGNSDNDYLSIDGRVGLSHRLTRQLGFHAGYFQNVSRYVKPGAEASGARGPDLGLDFGDAGTFRLTRRTTASLGVSATSAYSGNSTTRYALTGNAGIVYSMSRTWSASAVYARNFGFSALFEQAILTDTLTGTIGGQLAPRTTWSSSAGWSYGKFSESDNHYTTYSATTGLQLALARVLSAYAQYGLYRYTVPPGSTTLGILSTFSRQTVSVGLTTSVPVFNNVRAK